MVDPSEIVAPCNYSVQKSIIIGQESEHLPLHCLQPLVPNNGGNTWEPDQVVVEGYLGFPQTPFSSSVTDTSSRKIPIDTPFYPEQESWHRDDLGSLDETLSVLRPGWPNKLPSPSRSSFTEPKVMN